MFLALRDFELRAVVKAVDEFNGTGDQLHGKALGEKSGSVHTGRAAGEPG